MTRTAWWRGARGEWYVVAQIALIVAVFKAPRNWQGAPPFPLPQLATLIGGVLLVVGGWIFLVSALALGTNLTPLPHPRRDSTLVETGPYRFVRHPIYAAGILVSYGWALFAHGWLTLAYATVLLVMLDIKSRREERWLIEKFPGYRDYRRRVRRFVPFVY